MVDRLTAMRNTEFTGEVSDENGWRCRLFENGNVHICIDSISLLNALNDLISIYFANQLKWFTEFGHLNRGDMLTSEQHRCHNEKKKFQRRV
ncbi:hypothetical protein DNV88_24560 [Salmonella enterica subsp. enterica serovar Agona]|uniref:Uncharacterized protein n=1 Tax=Salmonella enterica subsp. enterica serovar Agona TaxID=58095 RepID=A0A5U6P1X5_SALET|nr:hypothetical protein [Salmonella enterica subsp. enterica serovar Agona]